MRGSSSNALMTDNQAKPKLYFCFPSRLAGGISTLFLRIAQHLSETGQAQTTLIDYKDGTMSRNHDSQLTNLLIYSDESAVTIPKDGILILQSMTPWSMFSGLNIHDNVRVIFWTCHPFNLVPTLPGIRTHMQANKMLGTLILNTVLKPYKKKMKCLTSLMCDTDALIFQDSSCIKITEEYLGIKIEKPLMLNIPALPVEKLKDNPQERIKKEKLLKFSWVGRIADMKYFTLKNAISKLDAIQKNLGYQVELTIIGEGNYLPRLKNFCASLNNIMVIFIRHLDPIDLDEFLLHKTDALFAMGTSALEGVKLGIPTLPLDISYHEIPDGYIYEWLHERGVYSPSQVLDFDGLEPGNDSLESKIRQLATSYREQSDRELNYFKKYHSISAISELLLQYCLTSSFNWRVVKERGFLKRGYLYSLFRTFRRWAVSLGLMKHSV